MEGAAVGRRAPARRWSALRLERVNEVVIIGGGFAGLRAARALAGRAVEVTLVDRSNHHLFQPLLYQVATAALSPADIAYPIRAALRSQDNARVLLGEVTAVDLEQRRLTLLDGAQLRYDFLVVAVGMKNDYFGREERWATHALGLKTLDEALEIRRRVLLAFEAAEREPDADKRRRLLSFIVIGGGPTGVEVAGALSELAANILAEDFRRLRAAKPHVLLVERGERLLSGGFDPRLSARARTQLEELGVEVRTSTEVLDIDERGVRVSSGLLEAANVFWTAGVKGRSLAQRLGVPLDRGGRVIVRPDCSLEGHPEVFVIGDIAHLVPAGSERPLPGLAPVAIQQGGFVARQIVRRLAGEPPEAFRYVDKGIMATVGRSRAVAQTGRLRLSGLIAWLAWLVVHIAYLIGFRNRSSVLFNWTWSYLTFKRGARLITGERSWARLAEYGVASPPLEAPTESSGAAPPGSLG